MYIYLIHTSDGLHVKRIKAQGTHHYMSSMNEKYVDVKLDEFQVIGEVKGLFQKF
ncbi:MAG: hypothetical protein NTW78_05810 [Campylobacterales bacterium]|nr:hypothetical protein [Campylobacterales bacterium]